VAQVLYGDYTVPGFQGPVDLTFLQCNEDIGSFADGIYSEANRYEGPDPKTEYARKYRWSLEIIGGPLAPGGVGPVGGAIGGRFDRETRDTGILIHLKKCSRPTPEFEIVKAHHAQSVISRPGKISWSPITMSFYEAFSDTSDGIRRPQHRDSIASRLYQWWANTIYDHRTNLHGNISDYLKDAVLTMGNGVGDIVYSYNLYNCWISKITPSDLDYSSNEVCEIEITLNYDLAVEVQ
jgi:hypothetical protein